MLEINSNSGNLKRDVVEPVINYGIRRKQLPCKFHHGYFTSYQIRTNRIKYDNKNKKIIRNEKIMRQYG